MEKEEFKINLQLFAGEGEGEAASAGDVNTGSEPENMIPKTRFDEVLTKSKEKDKKGFHKAFVIQSHYGHYLDAEEMFLETRDKMIKELEENLKEKFKRSNYTFFIQVISENFTIDPIAEEKELDNIKKYYESLEAGETPETVH